MTTGWRDPGGPPNASDGRYLYLAIAVMLVIGALLSPAPQRPPIFTVAALFAAEALWCVWRQRKREQRHRADEEER